MASSSQPADDDGVMEDVDCLDAVNETLGMGAMEVDQDSTLSPPKKQISNLSLPKKKSDVAGACSNLVNSIVGAGIIGIPFALKESGLVAGVILLILVSYFTGKSYSTNMTKNEERTVTQNFQYFNPPNQT